MDDQPACHIYVSDSVAVATVGYLSLAHASLCQKGLGSNMDTDRRTKRIKCGWRSEMHDKIVCLNNS